MSADNGIYILKCKDQYRVIHAQAIDNLWWTPLNPNNQELVPTRLVEYYGNSRYTRDAEKAMQVATAIERKWKWTEYGIRTFTINKTWKQIVKEAKELAPKEIEILKTWNSDGRWDYEISRLEQIMEM